MPAHCNNQFVKNQFSIMKLQLIWPDLPYGFQHKTFTLSQDHCYYALKISTFLQSFHKVSSILWLIINLVKVKQFIWCFLSSHKYSNLAQVNNRKSKPFLGSHKSSKGVGTHMTTWTIHTLNFGQFWWMMCKIWYEITNTVNQANTKVVFQYRWSLIQVALHLYSFIV